MIYLEYKLNYILEILLKFINEPDFKLIFNLKYFMHYFN